VDVATLAAIARERGVPLVEDLGSGTLVDLRARGLPEESYAPARLRLGADVVCFSGDKLLGGPQAGILVGAAGAIDAMRGNPLARALRLDKMSLAALDWTADALLSGRGVEVLPTLRMLAADEREVAARARALAQRIEAPLAERGIGVAVVASRAPVGGGSLPGFELASWAVALTPPGGPDALAAALRAAPVPVIARVAEESLLLDARTLLAGDDDAIEAALGTCDPR
jgi:L-seryl-tRNA(Ser) seleniumtransferase